MGTSEHLQPRDHFKGTGKVSRTLLDLIVVAIFVGAAIVFFSKNGFVGSADVQPYPY